jgi:hypothetical protein
MTSIARTVGAALLVAIAGCGGPTGAADDASFDARLAPDTDAVDAAPRDVGHDAPPLVDVGSVIDTGQHDAGPACDLDHDHHAAMTTECGGDDCDDAVASTHPGQVEVCNTIDDDCDALIDEGVAGTFYPDADGDLFGDAAGAVLMACSGGAGRSPNHTDCNDANAAVHPGALETCDGIDNDCSGVADEGCSCTTGVTRPCGLSGACAGATQTCLSGLWGACSISPTTETCNGIDDDCNGTVDDGLRVTCYVDADGDTYAPAASAPTMQCPVSGRPAVGGCPVGQTNRAPSGAGSTDCNDANALVRPGAHEACDGVDNDCNAVIDDSCS